MSEGWWGDYDAPPQEEEGSSAPVSEEEQRFVTRVKSLMAILEAQLAEEEGRP